MELSSMPRRRADRARSAMLRTTAGLAVGGLLVLTFLRLVNVSSVSLRLSHLNISFALLCGAAFLAAYVVRALRWRWLLKPDQVSIARAVAIYQVAIFLNWLLPVRGGELAKGLILRQSNNIPISRSLATVSMDKAMDLLPAVVLLAALPLAGLHLSPPLWILLATALAAVGFGAGVLALAAWRREKALALVTWPLATFLPSRAGKRAGPFVVQFIDTLLALIRQPRLLAIAAAYTAVAVCLDALFCLSAFRAVGVAVPVAIVLYGYTLFNLSFILPTPPGQVGSNELIGLLIFSGVFGINRAGVAAMFLFSHPWTAILMTLTGLACLSAMGLSLRSTLRLAREGTDHGTQQEILPAHSAESWTRHDRARHRSRGLRSDLERFWSLARHRAHSSPTPKEASAFLRSGLLSHERYKQWDYKGRHTQEKQQRLDEIMRCPQCGVETPNEEWNCVSCRMNVYWASQHYDDLAIIRRELGLHATAETPSFLLRSHEQAMNERADHGGRTEHRVRQIARRAMRRDT